MMETSHIIIFLVTGVGVGFAGGLLGVGGAFIMTPVQYIIYTGMGIPADAAIKMAFATSLFIILPTAASGAWRHTRKGVVWWRAAFIMGACSLVAAFGGATLATHLSGAGLKITFGAVVLASAVRMLTVRISDVEEEPKDNPWLWAAWAIPVGFVTGMLGIGGGVLVVPVMVLALNFKMHNAIATSLAMMIFTSAGGAIGYIVGGAGVTGLPAHSLGYIYLPAWLLLAATSIGMAQVGAIAAQRLPALQLRYIFTAAMIYIGLRMLGVFDLLGLPI